MWDAVGRCCAFDCNNIFDGDGHGLVWVWIRIQLFWFHCSNGPYLVQFFFIGYHGLHVASQASQVTVMTVMIMGPMGSFFMCVQCSVQGRVGRSW